MANYEYTVNPNTISFGSRDGLPPGDANKIISGSDLDVQFSGITSGKLNLDDVNNFTGTIGNSNATVDGGTY